MNQKRFFNFLLLFLVSVTLWGQNPNGYYNSASGKSEAELKTALFQIISKHTVLTYSSIFDHFEETDLREDGTIWDMYSNNARYPGDYGFNREHAVPKSWWGGDKGVAAYTDINHLYPSDATANQAKLNYALGVVGNNPSFDNGVSKVGSNVYPGYTGNVFEPADEYKGDFARTYFYMVTCYQDYQNRWKYLYMINPNTYPVLKEWAVNMLMEWHREDPVSRKEIDRNEAVFQIQNNRNPFIDYPELADYIWGDKTDEVFELNTELYDPVLATPTNDTELRFGSLMTGETTTLSLYVRGTGLTGDLSVSLFGDDSGQFDVSTQTVPALVANSEEGYRLDVTYHPDRVDDLHTANIIIYDGGIDGSVAVNITGQSLAPESLDPPVAQEASDITSDGFTANWETASDAEGYFLQVYMEDEDKEEYELVFQQEVNEGITSFKVDNLESGKNYSYYVRKKVKGIFSAASDPVIVKTTSIRSVGQDQNISVWSNGAAIYVENTLQTPVEVKIYNISGTILFYEQQLTGVRTFSKLRPGIYFVQTGHEVQKVLIAQ